MWGGTVKSGSDSANIGTNGLGSKNVTFGITFKSVPTVVMTPNYSSNKNVKYTVSNVTTTGFTANFWDYGSGIVAYSLDFNYIATDY